MPRTGEKLYDVWFYVCDKSGLEGWDVEQVWATDKEAAFRKVRKSWEKYNEAHVALAETRRATNE